jgi:hypothetical protein
MVELFSCFSRFLWATGVLLIDAYESNARFLSFNWNDAMLWGYYFILTYAVVFYATGVLSIKRKPLLLVISVELLLVPLILFPLLVPSKAFSFFMGVQNCNYAMTIHSEAFYHLLQKSDKGKANSKSFRELLNLIFGFGIPKRLESLGSISERFPMRSVIVHFFLITITGDTCTYLIREWIPYHIQPNNVKWAVSLVGALWQMCALEFAYFFISTFCAVAGSPIPPEMNHRNPLLSTSLAEFWGIRWNPVIGKQLQDSIYKPLRKVGAGRPISIIACFTGSALIHAVPKIISDRNNIEEFLMMFGFFFSQGFCILLEFIMQKTAYWLLQAQPAVMVKIANKKAAKVSGLSSTVNLDRDKDKKIVPRNPQETLQLYETDLIETRSNFVVELAIMLFLISGFYLVFEQNCENKSLMAIDILLLVYILYQLVSVQIEQFASSNKTNQTVKFTRNTMIILIILGWCWTVSCFISQLPLYVMPMMTVMSEFYSQSLAIGPFIRTISKVYYFYS